jgi:hypothetical protein
VVKQVPLLVSQVPPQQSELCTHGVPSGAQPPPELLPLLLPLPPLLPPPPLPLPPPPLLLPLLLLPPAPHVPVLVLHTPLQQSEFCAQR